MTSSLKERLGRLGPIQDVDRVPCGSPVVLSLRPGPNLANLKTVDATLALAKRGLSLLRSKRAVEEMVERRRVVVLVPTVESEKALAHELADAGCVVASIGHHAVDVRSLRERLGLTQEQFALQYGLDLDAVRNWEHRRRTPDPAAQSYLRVIARLPEQASKAQEEVLAEPHAEHESAP
jgi:putative transcriptional regulator